LLKTYDESVELGVIRESTFRTEFKRANTFEALVQSGRPGFFKQIMIFNKRFIKGSSAE
jgi:hypothetical protein